MDIANEMGIDIGVIRAGTRTIQALFSGCVAGDRNAIRTLRHDTNWLSGPPKALVSGRIMRRRKRRFIPEKINVIATD
ncbi:MAG: hypothetical protein ACLR6J_18595 [Parabacteroides merdae]